MEIRREKYNDISQLVELANLIYPDFPTSEELERYYNDTKPNERYEQKFICEEEGKIIGSGLLSSCSEWFTEKSVFKVYIEIHPQHRSKGYARELYNLLLKHLSYLKWNKLQTWTMSDQSIAIDWIEREGFMLQHNEQNSKLDLSGYERPENYVETMEKLDSGGIRLSTFGEVSDNNKMKKLWKLYEEINYDMPSSFEYKKADYDEWKRRMGNPSHRIENIHLALDGDEFVGLTELCFPAGLEKNAIIETTGTLAPYRNRGIATALKYINVEWAKEIGVPAIVTGNEENNEYILKINKRLGFKPTFIWIGFVKENKKRI